MMHYIDPLIAPVEAAFALKAIVAPRPIGWISTIDPSGRDNLAPYSFFNAVEDTPPMLLFSSSGEKDSVRNARATGEFVCSLVTRPLLDAMNRTSAPLAHGESEFDHAGLARAPSSLVAPPRVRDALAALECRVVEIRTLRDLGGAETGAILVIGQVVAMHVAARVVRDGRVTLTGEGVAARLGGADYAIVGETVSLRRPGAG
jgi:flavin reductase (DIM6/NTAB) family NADH-FMN oxidoreductase RutF